MPGRTSYRALKGCQAFEFIENDPRSRIELNRSKINEMPGSALLDPLFHVVLLVGEAAEFDQARATEQFWR